MYIAPNSTIRIMKGVPLDNTYTDTIYFNDKTLQYNHFLTYTSKVFSNVSYQRVRKGTIRLQVLADTIYDYNYMMFQNTAYGNKWFYAFILSVEYINDNTSEITYEIDEMQTWITDAILEPSYVVREHSETDVVGENLAPEPVDIGPVICTQVNQTDWFNSYTAVIAKAKSRTT